MAQPLSALTDCRTGIRQHQLWELYFSVEICARVFSPEAEGRAHVTRLKSWRALQASKALVNVLHCSSFLLSLVNWNLVSNVIYSTNRWRLWMSVLIIPSLCVSWEEMFHNWDSGVNDVRRNCFRILRLTWRQLAKPLWERIPAMRKNIVLSAKLTTLFNCLIKIGILKYVFYTIDKLFHLLSLHKYTIKLSY